MLSSERIKGASINVLLQQLANWGLRLSGNLILTRLLAPDAFGIIAVVYTFLTGLGLLSDFGVAQNVSTSPRGSQPQFLNTAWSFNVARGGLICFAMLSCGAILILLGRIGALPEGTTYADPQLPFIVGSLGVAALISGLESTKALEARRNLQLSKLTVIEIASQAVSLVLMLALAFAFRSVWALVSGALLAASVKTVATHVLLTGTQNRFHWERRAGDEILNFGKWMVLSSALFFAAENGDKILLGGLLSPADLGAYAIATLLLGAIQGLYASFLGSVVLPALSAALRNGVNEARETYFKFQIYADIGLFFAAGALFRSAPAIVSFLYDARYEQAGLILKYLSLALIGQRYAVAEQCFIVFDRVRYFAAWNALRAVVVWVGLPLLFAGIGFNGVIVTVVLSQFAGWPLALAFKREKGLLRLKEECAGIPALVAGLIAGNLLSVLLEWLGAFVK